MHSHKFDVADATKYGIEKAILLEHLRFHQQANEGNPDLVFDGKTHSYLAPNTVENMYPYLTPRSVYRWLKELENEGVIESRKPHASEGKHLKYYYVKDADKSNKNMNRQNGESKSQNGDSYVNRQNGDSSNNNHVYKPYGVEDENFVEGLLNAKTKKELLTYWSSYRNKKLKSLTIYEKELILKVQWKKFTVDQIREEIITVATNGWMNLRYDQLKESNENGSGPKSIAWARERGYMEIEKVEQHARKEYNQPLENCSGLYIYNEFEGQILGKHV